MSTLKNVETLEVVEHQWGVRWHYEEDSIDSYDEVEFPSEALARAAYERSDSAISVLHRRVLRVVTEWEKE